MSVEINELLSGLNTFKELQECKELKKELLSRAQVSDEQMDYGDLSLGMGLQLYECSHDKVEGLFYSLVVTNDLEDSSSVSFYTSIVEADGEFRGLLINMINNTKYCLFNPEQHDSVIEGVINKGE